MAAANQSGEARARVRVERGSGVATVSTGLPVLDHLLTLFARYAALDVWLDVMPGASSDEIVRVGCLLGESLREPLAGEGARGHGFAILPADEALANVALDASHSPRLVTNFDLSSAHVGGLETDLIAGFLRELARGARLTLHVRLIDGEDTQHVLDAIFKALGAAVGHACARKEA